MGQSPILWRSEERGEGCEERAGDIELFFGVEEAEEEVVHLAAEGRGCLLPQIAVDAEIVGDGCVLSFSDSVIYSLTCLDVSRQKIDSDAELRPNFAQEFPELLKNLNFFFHFLLKNKSKNYLVFFKKKIFFQPAEPPL